MLKIVDRWSHKYGDLEIESNKLSTPRNMVEQLHCLGVLVTLSNILFCCMDSSAIIDSLTNHCFAHYVGGTDGEIE